MPGPHPPTPALTGDPTIRLAMLVSAVAAPLAVALRAVTDISRPAIVAAVMIVAFGLSWHATWRDEFTGL